MNFSRENATLFLARNCLTTLIEDQVSLGREILARSEVGEWDHSHVVITELLSVESGTILISNSSSGHIDFGAKSDIGAEALNLANASIGLQVLSSLGIGVQILASAGLTPLFRVSGLKRRLLGGSRFDKRASEQPSLSIVGDQAAQRLDFVDIDYDDLEEG